MRAEQLLLRLSDLKFGKKHGNRPSVTEGWPTNQADVLYIKVQVPTTVNELTHAVCVKFCNLLQTQTE